MSEVALSIAALEKGLEIGAVGFKKAKEIFRETWREAFGEFDVEKVFWRTIYAEGIFWTLSLLWQYAILPLKGISEVLSGERYREYRAIVDCILEEAADLPFAERLGINQILVQRIPIGEKLAMLQEAGYGDLVAACTVAPEEGDPDPTFELENLANVILVDYRDYITLGIPLLFLFLEYRRVKRLRELL